MEKILAREEHIGSQVPCKSPKSMAVSNEESGWGPDLYPCSPFRELTPRFKKLKRRASLEFCVHLDMSQIGIVCLQNGVWDFQNFQIHLFFKNSEYLKSYRDFTSFSETQVKGDLRKRL